MQKLADKNKKIIQDVSLFTASTYFSQALYFCRGFLNAKFLGPGLYGIWSGLNIILNYSTYANLGALSAMNREIPYHNGRRLTEDMDIARNVTFTISLITSLVFSFALIIISFLYRKTIPMNVKAGMITISFISLISSMYEFYSTSFIAEKRFALISKANIIFAVLSVMITIILVPVLKIYGVYIAAIIIPLLALLYLWIKEPCKAGLSFNFQEIKKLITIGFPIMSINFLQSTMINIAGIIVLAMFGTVNMGYCSVAMLGGRFLMYAPSSIHRIFEPHIYQKYGETHQICDLRKYIFRPTLIMAFLFPAAIGFYYTGITFFIRHFLPKYAMSIDLFFIVIIAAFFVSFSPTAFAFLNALNKQRFLIPVYLAGIALMIFYSVIFTNKGMGIIGVGFGLLLSFFFTGSVVFIYAITHFIKNTFKCVAYLAGLCLPLVYIIIVVVLNEVFIPCSSEFFQDVFNLIIKMGIVFIFSLPLVFIADKKTGILSDFFKNRHI